MSLMKAVFASMMLVLTSACVLHEGRWLFLSDRSVALEDLGPFAMYCSSNFEKSPCSAALPVIQMPNGVHRIHIPKSEVQLQELASAWGIVGEGDAELISGHLEKGIAYDVLGAKVGKERLIELRLHLTSSPRQLARSYIFGWRWDGILMGCDPAGSDKCSTKGKSVRDLSFDKTLTNGVFFGTRSELAISGTRFGDFFQQEIAETAKRIAEKAQAEAAKAAEAAREKVEKAAEAAEELLNPKLRFSNGDTFEAGDTLFRKHSENKYETVTLVEIRKDRVKVRLPDGSNAWLAKSEFMTRDMVDAAKSAYQEERDARRRERERREADRVRNCCCYIKGTDFWDITLFSRKWMSTKKCRSQWEGWTTMRGGIDFSGTCQGHQKSSCKEF